MPEESKAVCFTLWFQHQMNFRHAELFPRLSSIVQFRRVTLSRHRIARGVQYRLWHAFRRTLIYPVALRYFGQRFEILLTVDCSQIAMWPRPKSVVIDIDDPIFGAEELNALNLPQVKAIVVTTDKAKQIFESLGIMRPIHVIPQGVPVGQIDPERVAAIRNEFKNEHDVIAGYHAPSLTMAADGSHKRRSDQDDLDFLFSALEKARSVDPRIKLWLFGTPSDALKKHVTRQRDAWVKLFGYVPSSEMLNYLANVDIGVYPRTWTPPPARFSVKIAQFMGCGIPIVARDLDESAIIQEAGCGVVCRTEQEFSDNMVQLARDKERRAALGNAGVKYAEAHLDWSVLVPIYKKLLTS